MLDEPAVGPVLADLTGDGTARITALRPSGRDVVARWTTTRGCCSDPESWSARLHWDGRQVRVLGAEPA